MSIRSTAILLACCFISASSVTADDIQFERVQLDARFRSEGAAMGDFNQDGLNDIVAGDYWYEAPAWTAHELRPPGDFWAGVGYSQSFCNWTWDINDDGWDDIIVVGFPGDPFHWYENPQNAEGHWEQHEIWHSICNESPQFKDLTGDGKPDFVLGSQPESQMGYIEIPEGDAVYEKWAFVPVSTPGDPMRNGTFKYYHGIGVTDVNGDGRTDVAICHGYWEQPEELGAGAWEFRPYLLAEQPDGDVLRGADIYADDLDGDGDNDLLMSCAHSFGVWWFENIAQGGPPEFRYHLIDDEHSQTHALHYVDLDGDGARELVTGKRYFAHNGNDPGGLDPVRMYYYELKKGDGAAPEFVRHEITAGADTGVGTQFSIGDVDGDDRPDVILSNKKGVNVLLQQSE